MFEVCVTYQQLQRNRFLLRLLIEHEEVVIASNLMHDGTLPPEAANARRIIDESRWLIEQIERELKVIRSTTTKRGRK